MKIRKGDTLVEVAIALGIFSLVSITIVSVVSASTSSAQSALEVTTSREEIDTQAEALRFIHDSLISGGQTSTANRNYVALWKRIVEDAVTKGGDTDETLAYNPTTCSELYDVTNGPSQLARQNAFIINPRTLGNIDKAGDNPDRVINTIVLRAGSSSVFQPAATSPRLLYGDQNQDENGEQNLLIMNQFNSSTLIRAEGIYIVAVRDNDTTILYDAASGLGRRSAYYDFYIRTCWFATGAERPSTVSTVVRLYDPTSYNVQTVEVIFDPNTPDKSNPSVIIAPQRVAKGEPARLKIETYSLDGYDFVGWSFNSNTDPSDTANIIRRGGTVTLNDNTTLYAIWKPKEQ